MFKILDEVCTPTRGSKYSACVDLYAREDVTIGAGETVKVPLGVCIDLSSIKDNIALSHGYEQWLNGNTERAKHLQYRLDAFLKSHYLQLMLRSSLGKKGLILPNGVGVIDLDYQDEIMIIMHNPLKPYTLTENGEKRTYVKSTDVFRVKKGDKIAQITLLEHKSYLFGVDTDEERKGGFGSTGK